MSLRCMLAETTAKISKIPILSPGKPPAIMTATLSAADADGSRAMINCSLVRLKCAGAVIPLALATTV